MTTQLEGGFTTVTSDTTDALEKAVLLIKDSAAKDTESITVLVCHISIVLLYLPTYLPTYIPQLQTISASSSFTYLPTYLPLPYPPILSILTIYFIQVQDIIAHLCPTSKSAQSYINQITSSGFKTEVPSNAADVSTCLTKEMKWLLATVPAHGDMYIELQSTIKDKVFTISSLNELMNNNGEMKTLQNIIQITSVVFAKVMPRH